MIHSMTAFARTDSNLSWGSISWELRSVNHRYLEPTFKLPDCLRQLEPEIRDRLRHTIARGKLDCSARITFGNTDNSPVEINEDFAKAIIAASEKIQNLSAHQQHVNPIDILRWPGVVVETTIDQSTLVQDALTSFEQTLMQLQESRAREGAELQYFLTSRVASMNKLVDAVTQELPEILAEQQQRLRDKVSELTRSMDDGRLEQELVILAQKADVAEEMDRLSAHLNEVNRVINIGGTCGRRLDFLMQELNREANTLSSKSGKQTTTQAAVEMKVLIEQMREQIQNIE